MKTSVTFTHGAVYPYKASRCIYNHLVAMGLVIPNPTMPNLSQLPKEERIWEQPLVNKEIKDQGLVAEFQEGVWKARAEYIIAHINQLTYPQKLTISYSFPTLYSTKFTVEGKAVSHLPSIANSTVPSSKPSVTPLEPSEGFCEDIHQEGDKGPQELNAEQIEHVYRHHHQEQADLYRYHKTADKH